MFTGVRVNNTLLWVLYKLGTKGNCKVTEIKPINKLGCYAEMCVHNEIQFWLNAPSNWELP